MEKINFINKGEEGYEKVPLNAETLNKMQDNIEREIENHSTKGTTEKITVAANSVLDVTVTFQEALSFVPEIFSQVYADSQTAFLGSVTVAVLLSSVTNQQFVLRCYNNSSQERSFVISWLAAK